VIHYEEALRIALDAVRPLDAERRPTRAAAGLVLAADAVARCDLPPFDRAAMDGYAVRSSDLAAPGRELVVVGEALAGRPAPVGPAPGECVRVFTGAVVPEGADAVVMQELTSRSPREGCVRFEEPACAGEDIALRGEDVRAGEVLMRAGTVLGAAEVGLATAADVPELAVVPRPTVSIVSTGNELVPAGTPLRAGAIRDANGPALAARLASAGLAVEFLGVARDEAGELSDILARGLAADCLIVSGGVSVGEHDLVPEALAGLGVGLRFESVAIKPGKPTKFGMKGQKAVFGVPGNPVSALVVTEFLVLPILRRMAGVKDAAPRPRRGVLSRDVRKKPGRMLFAPGRLVEDGRGCRVEPVESHGSADLVAYSRADVVFTLPADADGAPAGAKVEFYPREGRGLA